MVAVVILVLGGAIVAFWLSQQPEQHPDKDQRTENRSTASTGKDARTAGETAAVKAFYKRLEQEPENADLWRALARHLVAEQRLRAAIGPMKRALTLDIANGARAHTGIGYNELGHLYLALAEQSESEDERADHHARAAEAFGAAIVTETALQNPVALGQNLRALARLHNWAGRPGQAAETYGEAAVAFLDAGRGSQAARMLAEQARLTARGGDPDRAVLILQRVRDYYAQWGNDQMAALTRRDIGRIQAAAGDHAAACAAWIRAAQEMAETGLAINARDLAAFARRQNCRN